MTTTAATSPSTTTTSTTPSDESPTILDNGTSSTESASQIDTVKHQTDHQQQSDCQRPELAKLQHDESNKSNQLPAAPRAEQEQSAYSPDVQVTGSANNNVPSISQPAPSSSSSSSASTPPPISTQQPPSIIPVSKDGVTDAKHNQSISSLNQPTTNSTNSSSEQKRPMNAFLLFCKRQRSLVREKHPNLENRGITKILGDWWTNLDKEQKTKYTDLARQHKEAFMKANPDFKWCKTPNVSNLNNNTSSANDSCPNNRTSEQKHQSTQNLPQSQTLPHQQNNLLYHHNFHQNNHLAPATNADLLSLQSIHNHTELTQNHSTNSFGMNASNSHQLEAPKPPKKRFLERNDSIYTSKDNSSSSSHLDTSPHIAETVSCFSLQQDILDRVIDKAFSNNSDSNKPSGINNLCKSSNRNPANLTLCLSNNSNNQSPFSTTASTISASSSNPMSVDEPVDFSMCRTINTTKQQLIENMVEKLFPKPSDESQISLSNPNGTESNFKRYSGPPAKKDKSDAT